MSIQEILNVVVLISPNLKPVKKDSSNINFSSLWVSQRVFWFYLKSSKISTQHSDTQTDFLIIIFFFEKRNQKQNTLDFQEVTYPLCTQWPLPQWRNEIFNIHICFVCQVCALSLPKPLPGNFDNLISFYRKTF